MGSESLKNRKFLKASKSSQITPTRVSTRFEAIFGTFGTLPKYCFFREIFNAVGRQDTFWKSTKMATSTGSYLRL